LAEGEGGKWRGVDGEKDRRDILRWEGTDCFICGEKGKGKKPIAGELRKLRRGKGNGRAREKGEGTARRWERALLAAAVKMKRTIQEEHSVLSSEGEK